MCCSKFILFVSNAIIFVLGVGVVGIASATIHRGSDYGSLLLDGVITLPVIILIIGLVVCVFGFLGCFGAIKESKCMLYTYAGIVLVLFLGEIVIAILLIAHPNITKNALDNLLWSEFTKYGGPDQALTKSIDLMQDDLECCGVYGYSDWKGDDFQYWNHKGQAPWSCCHDSPDEGRCDIPLLGVGQDDIHTQGCLDAVIEEYKDITIALGIAGIVLAIFMFFSMSTACGLARKHP